MNNKISSDAKMTMRNYLRMRMTAFNDIKLMRKNKIKTENIKSMNYIHSKASNPE